MNPQISSDDIGRFYPSDYAPHKAKRGKKQQNQRIFKSEFKRKPLSTAIYDKLGQHGRLLDIGCGNANFLHAMKTMMGCSVYGVDNSKIAAKTAKENYGINIFNGTILECPFPDGYFDVITAWWCLEHVPNPSEVLRKIFSMLNQDGYCVIGVPNFDSFTARTFKDKWYHLDCPRHLYIYSPDTITKLLDKTGFDVIKKFFDKTPWGLFRSLRYYFGDDDIPLKHRKRFKGSSHLKRLLLPWSYLLALLGKSDIMVVYAQKKQTRVS
jgi:SAM-dependent methyltransferase